MRNQQDQGGSRRRQNDNRNQWESTGSSNRDQTSNSGWNDSGDNYNRGYDDQRSSNSGISSTAYSGGNRRDTDEYRDEDRRGGSRGYSSQGYQGSSNQYGQSGDQSGYNQGSYSGEGSNVSQGSYGQGGSYGQRYGNQDRSYSSGYGNDRRREEGYYGRERNEERDWLDRTADEVSSWFGNEEAQRRRELDRRQREREDRQYNTYSSYGSESRQSTGLHRGKGPRNYKRSDDRIREDINDRLSDDDQLDASNIEVAVSNCEVTLTGTVDNRSDKRRAEDIAEAVSGVSNVENRLRVGSSDTGYTGDQRSSSVTSSPFSNENNRNTETGGSSSTGSTLTGSNAGTKATG